MTILDIYDPAREAILSPQDLAPGIAGFPETAICTFNQRAIDLAVELYGGREIGCCNAGVPLPIWQIRHRGVNLAVYRTLVGGPASAMLLEEVFSKGAKRVLCYGSCGTLSTEIPEGALILPTAAYRDEGTSYHYLPAGPETVEVSTWWELAEHLTEMGVAHVAGKTWTTDALYRETRRNLERRKAQGCLTVEMECASIMAVAAFRGKPVYQFLHAADHLDAAGWDDRNLGTMPEEGAEGLLRVAVELAARLGR